MTTDKTPATLATAKHGGCVQLPSTAAHVLVGQERVAWASTGATGHKVVAMPGLHKLPYGDYDLYAAPPAQAVDLSSVRALLQRRIEQWRSHLPADPDAPGTREIETKGERDYNNDVRIYREGIAVMQEVLSLTARHPAAPPAQAVDPADPWRGLYAPERLPTRHPEHGDTFHPDLPSWPDDEQQSIVPLLHAQGFEVYFVQGEFSEDVFDDDGAYREEMRNWQPEPPAGNGWRLAAVGDTEDGPYATFVRPLALAEQS